MNDKPKAPPRGQIGPRIGYLAKQVRQQFNKTISEEGLFSGQEDIILALSDKGSMSISEIASEMGVTTATTSVSIDRLQKNGFVIKEPDFNDSRKIKISLTEKGKKVPKRIIKKMGIADENFTKGFTQEEKELLSDMLDKLANNLKGDKQ